MANTLSDALSRLLMANSSSVVEEGRPSIHLLQVVRILRIRLALLLPFVLLKVSLQVDLLLSQLLLLGLIWATSKVYVACTVLVDDAFFVPPVEEVSSLLVVASLSFGGLQTLVQILDLLHHAVLAFLTETGFFSLFIDLYLRAPSLGSWFEQELALAL